MRGLKRLSRNLTARLQVAPHTGAWIETQSKFERIEKEASHPTRVRGLKQGHALHTAQTLVAPHTGAWIETIMPNAVNASDLSHPTRVRGLKHKLSHVLTASDSRTPHGCVD